MSEEGRADSYRRQFGLACAVAAGYTALGHVLKSTFDREVLPLGSV